MSPNANGALCLPGVNCGTCLNSTYCSSCWPGTGMTINRTCVYCSNYIRCSSCNGDIPSQCYACNTYFNLTINNIVTELIIASIHIVIIAPIH
jgi:hypothetical protein